MNPYTILLFRGYIFKGLFKVVIVVVINYYFGYTLKKINL